MPDRGTNPIDDRLLVDGSLGNIILEDQRHIFVDKLLVDSLLDYKLLVDGSLGKSFLGDKFLEGDNIVLDGHLGRR